MRWLPSCPARRNDEGRARTEVNRGLIARSEQPVRESRLPARWSSTASGRSSPIPGAPGTVEQERDYALRKRLHQAAQTLSGDHRQASRVLRGAAATRLGAGPQRFPGQRAGAARDGRRACAAATPTCRTSRTCSWAPCTNGPGARPTRRAESEAARAVSAVPVVTRCPDADCGSPWRKNKHVRSLAAEVSGTPRRRGRSLERLPFLRE